MERGVFFRYRRFLIDKVLGEKICPPIIDTNAVGRQLRQGSLSVLFSSLSMGPGRGGISDLPRSKGDTPLPCLTF
ncbi:MAG: hypothetical protein MUO24_10295 [Desulfobacterales bacterium]|nr:hypothetical protein [Desulfobacterales bacterium]